MSILPLTISNVVLQKKGATILNDISLELSTTGVTVVMGPNGAGKTSLLRLMHGLEKRSSGDIAWSASRHEVERQQSFVFQTPILLRRTALENAAYPLHIRGVSKEEAHARARLHIKEVGLEEACDRPVGYLSGGEKQKLAIARALITKPTLLFLDEPTTNLDGRSTREIEEILRNASNNGTRIVMTTHDIGQAKRLATEVLFLYRGTLNASADAKHFFNKHVSAEATAYLNGDILE